MPHPPPRQTIALHDSDGAPTLNFDAFITSPPSTFRPKLQVIYALSKTPGFYERACSELDKLNRNAASMYELRAPSQEDFDKCYEPRMQRACALFAPNVKVVIFYQFELVPTPPDHITLNTHRYSGFWFHPEKEITLQGCRLTPRT